MRTRAITRLKFTTRRGYETSARTYLLLRWKNKKLAEVGYVEFEELDADLKKGGLKPASRGSGAGHPSPCA